MSPACIDVTMIHGCPNLQCHFFQSDAFCKKDGSYFRKDDSRRIQRFKCQNCNRKFSASTSTLEFRQKKRRVNQLIFRILSSGVSMRRSAMIAGVHRTTIDRKLLYLANKSRKMHAELLAKIGTQNVAHLQFDDLITKEHTKLKPLSVTIAIDAKTRHILASNVSQIPAFGHLAKIAKTKYGRRKSSHREALDKTFFEIKDVVAPEAKIESDEHQSYAECVQKYFPRSSYVQYKGAKGAIIGQGELKKIHRDPLFMINHTCAMFRANINRLVRKTWCVTKRPERLQDHIAIYMAFHNFEILK